MLAPSKLSKGDRLRVEFPLCTILTSIFELSERLQIPLDSWEEPGMGQTHGLVAALPLAPLLSLWSSIMRASILAADLTFTLKRLSS